MPTPVPDLVDTIERFAELSALLDDPLAEEADVLRAVGLDLAGWEAIEARWMARLRSGTVDVEDIVQRFGKVYRATRATVSSGGPSAAVNLAAALSAASGFDPHPPSSPRYPGPAAGGDQPRGAA